MTKTFRLLAFKLRSGQKIIQSQTGKGPQRAYRFMASFHGQEHKTQGGEVPCSRSGNVFSKTAIRLFRGVSQISVVEMLGDSYIE